MIRRGYYCLYKGKIYECSVRKLNVLLYSNDIDDLKLNEFFKNICNNEEEEKNIDKYLKEVPKDEIEWFCRIGTVGYYKGRKVAIFREDEDTYTIYATTRSTDDEVFNVENGFDRMGAYEFEGKVPKDQVTDIHEKKGIINEEYKAPDNWDF